MRKSHEGILGVKKDSYPGLPDVLKEFNYYYQDGETGHVIMAIPESVLSEYHNYDLDMLEVPIPCKYVLEYGFRLYKDHIIVDCEYSTLLGGVWIEPKYYECDEATTEEEPVYAAFEVGKEFPVNAREGIYFNLDRLGGTLFIKFTDLKPDEISQYRSDKQFEIRLLEINKVLMLMFRFGNTNWADTSFNPRICNIDILRKEIPDGAGFPLTVYVIEARNNILKEQRLIGLGTSFSRKLQEVILRENADPMTVIDFQQRLNQVYSKYSTNELVKIATLSYKI